MRTLVLTLLPVGVLFGAVEVAVTAASDALEAASAAGLALVLAVLAAGHLALAGATGSLPAIGALLALGGAAIAPTFAAEYAMVDEAGAVATITVLLRGRTLGAPCLVAATTPA